jgi:hypothetical protein
MPTKADGIAPERTQLQSRMAQRDNVKSFLFNFGYASSVAEKWMFSSLIFIASSLCFGSRAHNARIIILYYYSIISYFLSFVNTPTQFLPLFLPNLHARIKKRCKTAKRKTDEWKIARFLSLYAII